MRANKISVYVQHLKKTFGAAMALQMAQELIGMIFAVANGQVDEWLALREKSFFVQGLLILVVNWIFILLITRKLGKSAGASSENPR